MELADKAGLARSYIGQIESGLKNASLETIGFFTESCGIGRCKLKMSIDLEVVALEGG